MDSYDATAPAADITFSEARAAPLFIGLLPAAERAERRGGVLARMLQQHSAHLQALETAAERDEQALDLCGRLLGLVLDAENGGDLHALIRLRRGLRLAAAYLRLRSEGPVRLVPRLKSGDPDLRACIDGLWVDIDLRPRRVPAAVLPRYRLRLTASFASFERAA